MPNAGQDEAQAGIKTGGRNIKNLICRQHHPNGRKGRGTKEPLDEGEKESEKVALKLYIQKTKIMSSGPIISWQTERQIIERVRDFIFWGVGLQNHCRW